MPLFSQHHLAEHSLAPRRHAVQESFLVIPITWRYQQTARRHTSDSLLLVLALKMVGSAILKCSKIFCTLILSEFVSFQPYNFPGVTLVPKLDTFMYSLSSL